MIRTTIKKIKEIMEMVSVIMRSLVSIIGSLIATITVSITGYIEIKKLTAQARKTHEEIKYDKNHVSGASSSITATVGVESSSPELGYKMDYNTGVFFLAVVVLPIIFYFEKKKKGASK
jgi:hypothetical protein